MSWQKCSYCDGVFMISVVRVLLLLTIHGGIYESISNMLVRMVMTVWWCRLTLGGAICTSPAAACADDTTDLGFRTTPTHYATVPHPYLGCESGIRYYML